jgi:hypothetical protein
MQQSIAYLDWDFVSKHWTPAWRRGDAGVTEVC